MSSLQGASRAALVAGREHLDTLIDSGRVDLRAFAEELHAVVRLLDREVPLRRTFADPAQPGESKAALARRLFGDRVSQATLNVLAGLARARWSASRDLVDAVEILAVHVEVAAAEREGVLDDVEDELFRFGRIVAAQRQLRAGLSDPLLPTDRKTSLVQALLGGKVASVTERLVLRLVAHPRGRTIEQSLEEYARIAAERRERLIALVRVAVPLTQARRERLAAVLRRLYSRDVQLNIELDPTVVGGISVRVGDEVIDGTVASRLEGARQRLTG